MPEMCPMCEERDADREDGLCTECANVYPLEEMYDEFDEWDATDLDMLCRIIG